MLFRSIMSNINTEEDIPINANPILPTAKFPTGALTDTKEVIDPIVVIQPGVATGVAGVGSPRDRPPSDDVNPYGPAYTPIPALTLDSAVNESQVIEPFIYKSEPKFKLSAADNLNAPPNFSFAVMPTSESPEMLMSLTPRKFILPFTARL